MMSIESLLVCSQKSLIKANLLIKVSKVIVTKMSQKPKRKLMIEIFYNIESRKDKILYADPNLESMTLC